MGIGNSVFHPQCWATVHKIRSQRKKLRFAGDNSLKKLSLFFLFSLSFCIGLADFFTTIYGLNNGLIEADGLYFPFLSTIVLSSLGLTFLYVSNKIKNKLFNITGIICLSGFSVFLFLPIINNVRLIV